MQLKNFLVEVKQNLVTNSRWNAEDAMDTKGGGVIHTLAKKPIVAAGFGKIVRVVMNLPNNPSSSFRKRNPHLYPALDGKRELVVRERKIIRVTKTPEEKLNKLEKRFLEHIRDNRRCWLPSTRIGIQDIHLSIGPDCRYTPDFSVWASHLFRTILYEVKGPHTWDDAIVKIKTAAAQFPMFDFIIVTEGEDGLWNYQKVPS